MQYSFKKYAKFLAVAVLLFGVIVFLAYSDPQKLVEAIGAKNTYFVTFLLAIIGGVSSFSATGFYATIFAFSLGGANPLFLALFSAPGVLVGDFIFWYLGQEGRQAFGNAKVRFFQGLASWLRKKPRWFVPLFVYVYTGLTPLPGDVLMIALALMGYRFRQILIPTLLGNFTLALVVSLSAKLELF